MRLTIFGLLGIARFVLNGVVVADLWAWFVVPLGVSAISIPHAIGMDLIVTYLHGGKDMEDKNKSASKSDDLTFTAAAMFGRTLIAWAVGWFTYMVMVGWP
jgi:hypothetical protein